MKHRKDGSFGFNSWRVEENEEKIMNLYTSQDIDLKKFIEQYENGNLTSTKNFWKESKEIIWLVKNYHVSIIGFSIRENILFLSEFDDTDFDNAIASLNSRYS